MEFAKDNLETIVAVVAFLVAAWKAWKSGGLNTFLVKKVEGLASKEDKDAIKADAIQAGLQPLLDKVVKKAGLKKTPTAPEA